MDFTGLNLNNKFFNFNFSTGGYINSNYDTRNKFAFANLVDSFERNLINLFDKMQETNYIVNRLCIYNPLFNTIPVYCFKTIYLNDTKTAVVEKNSILGKIKK